MASNVMRIIGARYSEQCIFKLLLPYDTGVLYIHTRTSLRKDSVRPKRIKRRSEAVKFPEDMQNGSHLHLKSWERDDARREKQNGSCLPARTRAAPESTCGV